MKKKAVFPIAIAVVAGIVAASCLIAIFMLTVRQNSRTGISVKNAQNSNSAIEAATSEEIAKIGKECNVDVQHADSGKNYIILSAKGYRDSDDVSDEKTDPVHCVLKHIPEENLVSSNNWVNINEGTLTDGGYVYEWHWSPPSDWQADKYLQYSVRIVPESEASQYPSLLSTNK